MKLRLFLVLIVCTGGLFAAPPVWWPNNGTQQDAALNYAPANLGQLKNMAKKAKLHMDATLVGGAGFAVDSLVAGFGPDDGISFSAAEIAENYAPANIGQIKAVAKPFYDRLKAAGFNPNAHLRSHGLGTGWPYDYPWTPSTPVASNYAPANLGQLKSVFNFDLSSFDTDQDGVSDAWRSEFLNGVTVNAGANDDYDGDGLTNFQESIYNLDPKVSDTDYDGRSDAAEIADGTDPRDAASVSPVRLAYWKFDSEDLATEAGSVPQEIVSPSNDLVTGSSLMGLALNVTGRGGDAGGSATSRVTYREIEADGKPNVNFRRGSISLWVKPSWSSGASGGPGSYGRIVECGTWNATTPTGLWAVHFNPDGTKLVVVSQNNGSTFRNESSAINWAAGSWHNIVVAYGPTATKLYVDGSEKISVGGQTVYPPASIRNLGLRFGGNLVGQERADVVVDEVETFNYELSLAQVQAGLAKGYLKGTDSDADGMADAWESFYFSGITTNTGPDNDYDFDGLTNLQEYQQGTNPKEIDSDNDGRSDGQEYVDGTNPLDPGSVKSVRLSLYRMTDSSLLGINGEAPRTATTNTLAAGWRGKGVNVALGQSSLLAYNEADGSSPNINTRQGSVRLWIKPNWTTGDDLTSYGRIIEMGTWISGAPYGYWGLNLSPTGNQLTFASQNGAGGGSSTLSPTFVWNANTWHQVVVTYDSTGSKIYIDGSTAGATGAAPVVPPAAVRALGFAIGSDRSGAQRSHAVIDEVEFFNYKIPEAQITSDFAEASAPGADGDGDEMPDDWETANGLNPAVDDATGDLDGDGISNLSEYLAGTNPQVSDSEIGTAFDTTGLRVYTPME